MNTRPHHKHPCPKAYTLPVTVDGHFETYQLMVSPNDDLEGDFRGWCVDTGEFIRICGWAMEVTEGHDMQLEFS